MSEIVKDLSTLRFADYNPRIANEHFDNTLDASMSQFGDISGITNNMLTGNMVTGHQRVRKLQHRYGAGAKIFVEQRFAEPDQYGTVAIGFVGVEGTTVRFAYREVMWDEGTEKAANIAANRIEAAWDTDLLAKIDYELSQLENGADLLALTGQDEKEIQKLLQSIGVDNEPEEPPIADEEKPDKLEFALTRDQRLIIEHAIEHVKTHRDLQAVEKPSLNGAALFVLCQDYIDANPEPQTVPGELTDLPVEA